MLFVVILKTGSSLDLDPARYENCGSDAPYSKSLAVLWKKRN